MTKYTQNTPKCIKGSGSQYYIKKASHINREEKSLTLVIFWLRLQISRFFWGGG
jgi:hypothetical protein